MIGNEELICDSGNRVYCNYVNKEYLDFSDKYLAFFIHILYNESTGMRSEYFIRMIDMGET